MERLLSVTLLACLGLAAHSQAVGPSASYVDPMHTSWPVCDGRVNDGLDIAVPVGAPVVASLDGVVSEVTANQANGCGLAIVIQDDDGSWSGYGWLQESRVKKGDRVKAGQTIALTGQSGNATAPKLHWTLFTPSGEKVDARYYLAKLRTQADMDRLADLDVLKRAIDLINAGDDADYLKKQEIQYVTRKHEEAKRIADEQYTKNLREALDAWYANNKNWHKIPADVWNKLSERDRGRLKDGIDPETAASVAPGRNVHER